MKHAPFSSFLFATIYIPWALRSAIKKESVETDSKIELCADFLSTIIILSLISILANYPLEYVLYRIKYASVIGQIDPLYCLEASYTLLQGLFFFKMIQSDPNISKDSSWFENSFIFQGIFVAAFAIFQFVSHKPQLLDSIFIFSPFQDIHSFGSYASALLFAFVGIPLSQKLPKLSIIILAALFVVLIVMSGSKTAIASVMITVIIFCILIAKRKKKYIFGIALFFILLIVSGKVVFDSNIKRPNYYNNIIRGNLLQSVQERFAVWNRAIWIIRTFPFTGIGVGSFYRVSPKFHHENDFRIRSEINENAHNQYLQIASEIGLPGLLFFFGIIFFSYRSGLIRLKKQRDYFVFNNRILFSMTAYLITLMYNHSLILSSQQFLFYLMIASSAPPKKSINIRCIGLKNRYVVIIITLFFVLIGLRHAQRLHSGSTYKLNSEYGLYEKERMRWTGPMAGLRFTSKSKYIQFRVRVDKYNILPKGLDLYFSINNIKAGELHVYEPGWKFLKFELPFSEGNLYELKIHMSDTYNPVKLGLTTNIRKNRDQGVAISQLEFTND